MVTSVGRSAWFFAARVAAVYLTFATALHVLPPES
jgi:hypothetical protein